MAEIEETWRIDEGWWRQDGVSRRYWRLMLESGRTVTLYHDLQDDSWHEQHY